LLRFARFCNNRAERIAWQTAGLVPAVFFLMP